MPLIKDEDIEQVRERADIVDIVSAQVNLKKTGRVWKGLCPFHQEKTPSFTVNAERQTYHCFGCGEGGNVISYVMKTENLDFPDAVKTLADRVGYTLHYVEGAPAKKESDGRQAKVFKANGAALEFFIGSLTKTESGKTGLAYFSDRGFGRDVVDEFKLGYAPDAWDGLLNYASKKGFSQAELLEAGLVVRSEKNPNRCYDRFRGRVIFPIFDLQDRVIGFGGRVLGEGTPKYLNSPETPVFHKSHALYALNWAKDAIKERGEAVIVEGYTDVIGLMAAGVKNVVATLGTALGPDHLKLLSRYTNRVVFVFDADEAGRKAAARGLEMMRDFYLGPEYRKFAEFSESRHLDLYVSALPQGMDPADFAAAQGGQAFKDLISNAVPLVDFCLEAVFAAGDMRSVGGKQKTASQAMEIIAVLPSSVAREEYLKKIADRIGASYDALFDEFKKYSGRKSPGERQAKAPVKTARDPARSVEREILRLVLQVSSALDVLDRVGPEHFSHADLRELFTVLAADKKKHGAIEPARLAGSLSGSDAQLLTSLTSEEINAADLNQYKKDLLKRLKEFEIARRINTLKAQMLNVDPAIDPDTHDELFSRLLKLETERRENQ
jgi:DNA primase